jgi:membrane protein YqaA with SNARE-associated domain
MSIESVIAVFLASMLELWLAIPLGFALKLNAIVIATVSAAGSITAAITVSLVGDNLRNRLVKWRYKDQSSLNNSRLNQIWKKYGVVGLGLLSPLLFGAPIGAAVGVVLGAERNHLVFWMTIGIILWSIGLTIVAILGINII